MALFCHFKYKIVITNPYLERIFSTIEVTCQLKSYRLRLRDIKLPVPDERHAPRHGANSSPVRCEQSQCPDRCRFGCLAGSWSGFRRCTQPHPPAVQLLNVRLITEALEDTMANLAERVVRPTNLDGDGMGSRS